MFLKLSTYKLLLLGALLGAVAGYAYYFFVGCVDGTCAITSHPVNSTAYGALVGGLLFSGFKKSDTPSPPTP